MSAPSQPSHWAGLDEERLREIWGVPLLRAFAVVGSTNDVARALAEAGAPAGSVVVAESQTAGRGRRGRRWDAPPGAALLVSIVLRPDAGDADAELGTLPLRVGLGAARAIEELTGVVVSVKWPNDLLLGVAKVGGVLCEAALEPGRGGYVVAGIGINVAQTRAELPAELRGHAGSVLSETGRVVDRVALGAAVVREVVALARRAGPLEGDVAAQLAARDALAGIRISVDGVAAGVACGLSPDGALLVKRGENVIPIRSGTVRPTTGSS